MKNALGSGTVLFYGGNIVGVLRSNGGAYNVLAALQANPSIRRKEHG
jgi:hypothetical protein